GSARGVAPHNRPHPPGGAAAATGRGQGQRLGPVRAGVHERLHRAAVDHHPRRHRPLPDLTPAGPPAPTGTVALSIRLLPVRRWHRTGWPTLAPAGRPGCAAAVWSGTGTGAGNRRTAGGGRGGGKTLR